MSYGTVNAAPSTGIGAIEGVRAILGAALFFAAYAARPDYEALGPKSFWLYVICAAVFLGCALCGPVWVFDAPNTRQARDRAEWARNRALGVGVILYAVVFFNPSEASAEASLWLFLGGPPAAFLLWLDAPWKRLAALGARRIPDLDAEAYELERYAARENYRGTPDLPDGVEELLVSSGSFQVDRARMLEKLKLFQTDAPESFLLSWVRAAVLSKASRIEIKTDGGILVFSFDGTPLKREWVDDPYAALFEGGADSERHKHMAYGLLAALRLLPAEALVVSGGGRAHLSAKGGGARTLAPVPEASTTLTLRFDGWGGSRRVAEALARLREGYGLTETALIVDGETLDPNRLAGERSDPLPFSSTTTRGFVYARTDRDAEGRVRFYYHGALAAEEFSFWNRRPYLACASYEGMKLNGFLSGISESRAHKAAEAAIKKAVEKVLPRDGLGFGDLVFPRGKLAYTKEGLWAAAAGAVGAFAVFCAAAALGADTALVLAPACALVWVLLLFFLAGWTRLRLAGRRNPFRPQS